MNAVAACLGAYIYDRVAGTAGLGIEDLILADHAEGKCVDQGVAAVAGLELGFAAQIGYAEAVSITGYAADHAFDNGVVLVDQLPLFRIVIRFLGDRTESEGIHDRQRPRAHGEDVAKDATHSRRRPLERLNVAGMIVTFDLESTGPTVAHVNDSRVFTRALHHAFASGRQASEVHTARLV